MAIIEQIKKEREKKVPLLTSIFYRLAYILENEKLHEIEGNNFYEKIKEQIAEKKFSIKEKNKVEIPPFYLAKQEIYDKVKKIESCYNPYMQFANSVEEIFASTELWKIDKNIDSELLKKYHLSALLASKIAKEMLQEKIKEKADIEARLGQIDKNKYETASKKLAEIFGLKNYAKTKQEFCKFLDKLLEVTKKSYLEERIVRDFGVEAKDIGYEELVEKITKDIEKGKNLENLINKLKIKEEDLRVVRLMGSNSIEQLVNVKLKKYLEHLDTDKIEIEPDEINESLIGEKVRIYPGKANEEYDYGGTIESVPAGSEGTIKSIYSNVKLHNGEIWWVTPREIEGKIKIGEKVRIHPGNANGKYDCGGTIKDVPAGSEGIIDEIEIKIRLPTGEGWIVSPREIRLMSSFADFLKQKGLREEIVDKILKKHYDDVAGLCIKAERKNLEEKLVEIEDKIQYLTNLTI
jgi:hypothetical protein